MAHNKSFYMGEINKIPLLTLEEEKALATEAFSGSKTAQNKLVEANLRFVVKIANQYKNSNMDIQDLIAEGSIGLMHAAEKFNPENGNRFTTYAVFWIKAYIQKAIRENSIGIRLPATRYVELKSGKWNIASLDKKISNNSGSGGNDEKNTLGDLLEDKRYETPEEDFIENETKNLIGSFVELLNPNEQIVLTKRFGLDGNKPMSLSEIGNLLGYSKERIRQIEGRAKSKIKKLFDEKQVQSQEIGMAA